MNNVITKSVAELEAFLQTASVDELRDEERAWVARQSESVVYLVEAAHCETATT